MMKIEIEVTEEEIKSAVERKVRSAVADQTNNWGVDTYIKEQIKAQWKGIVDTLVKEALNDSAKLKDKITAEIERKLKAQLNAAIKAQSK
jgi:hypothetical protein